MGKQGLLPTSVRVLREIARQRRMESECAERAAKRARDRQEDAEEEVRHAERGIAPPGFYLVNEVFDQVGRIISDQSEDAAS